MKKHRGLSAVVGTVFLVAVVVSALSYVTYSMNVLGNFSESLITEEKRQKDKQGEAFEITSVNITPANKLDGVIKNTGQIPVEIKTLWIEEVGVPDSVKKFDIGKTIAPSNQFNLISSVDFVMDPNAGYVMKIISSRGTIQTFYVNSIGSSNLYLNSHALPEVVSTKFDTTILLIVTNNSTNNATILNLTPTQYPIIDDNSCTPVCSATYVSGPIPASYPSLKQGETAIFAWVYTITGDSTDHITFTTSLENGIATNTASSDVEIREIASSLESGTSLSTLGLPTMISTSDILYLHDETSDTPFGTYQAGSTTPDFTGDFIDIDNEDPSWITKNGTDQIIIPTGKWVASLNYLTEYLPDSLVTGSAVDLIYHLDANIDQEPDSTANTLGLDRCNNAPTYYSLGGPDNSPYYHFDGINDCIIGKEDPKAGISNVDIYPDTTALWFKTSNLPPNGRAVIFRADDSANDYTKEFYQITLGDGTTGKGGRVVFEMATVNAGPRTKCISSTNYDDNLWHHVVAVRDAANQCKLYVDGNVVHTNTCNTCASSPSTALAIQVSGKLKIGYDGDNDWFTGDVDQIMHWNDRALSPTEVTSLYASKYGDTSTLIDFSIYRTDQNGNNIEPAIKTSINYPIKFADIKSLSNNYNSLADNIWKHMNYTTDSLNSVTLDSQQRLNFTMVYKSGLDMILSHDDSTMNNNPKSSYIQMPVPDSSLPAYFVYDKSSPLKVIAYNSGPYGSWFVYQGTRAIFDSVTSTHSYAALICSINSTATNPCSVDNNNSRWRITEDRDSIFISVGSISYLYFWPITDRPDRNLGDGTVIPAGKYDMYVFIDGYDETGKTFLRQMDIGQVNVVD